MLDASEGVIAEGVIEVWQRQMSRAVLGHPSALASDEARLLQAGQAAVVAPKCVRARVAKRSRCQIWTATMVPIGALRGQRRNRSSAFGRVLYCGQRGYNAQHM